MSAHVDLLWSTLHIQCSNPKNYLDGVGTQQSRACTLLRPVLVKECLAVAEASAAGKKRDMPIELQETSPSSRDMGQQFAVELGHHRTNPRYETNRALNADIYTPVETRSQAHNGMPIAFAMSSPPSENVALIGLGSIGISFAALHLRFGDGVVTVFDTRPDLEQHLESVLPGYLGVDSGVSLSDLRKRGRLIICSSLEEACARADIVQEQGPENLTFKRDMWTRIEECAPKGAHMWTSTSGIAASSQNISMKDRSRLLVIHPFNPPHIMPLIEIVPSPDTRPDEVAYARSYFRRLGSGHRPIIINKELPGFVGNRLAYVLFREAAFLVHEDVISVGDLDAVIEASLGPRFAVQGPFKAYHMGGGKAGIRGFLLNLSQTIQGVWNSYQNLEFGEGHENDSWEEKVIRQTENAYGMPTVDQLNERDEQLRAVLGSQRV